MKFFRSLLPCGAVLALSVVLAEAQGELIPNDKFSDDGASWTLKTGPEASAGLSVVDDAGEKALRVEVATPSEGEGGPPDVRVQRFFGGIEKDSRYRVTFQARAEQPTKVVGYIYPENEGARVLWRAEAALEPEWKEFTLSFTGRDTADNCVLGFSQLGKMANTYFFKDVTLTAE